MEIRKFLNNITVKARYKDAAKLVFEVNYVFKYTRKF